VPDGLSVCRLAVPFRARYRNAFYGSSARPVSRCFMISRFSRESRGEKRRGERRRYRSLAYITRVVLGVTGDEQQFANSRRRPETSARCIAPRPPDCRRLRLSPDSVQLSRRVRLGNSSRRKIDVYMQRDLYKSSIKFREALPRLHPIS